MTTNGIHLAASAEPLSYAGLRRLNISIDASDAQTFQRVTSHGDFDKVWTGVIAAEHAGLTPMTLTLEHA